ncbi:putative oxidoreductase [Pseudonocardia saturnea]|uniref:Oxidoreductase n=1 Tax=Pseudonocardia saturnea TaxID=33909 RepID=A0ABQ0S3R6_9PSEU|nr:flavin reductase family protein [Pseudonocardia autotrophica]BBG00897.1 putative oxidoreductase [Pseudonocardia autotrophica]GEC27544.1 putative oxidoreductase [Pseudonocardia saturnea]
MSESLRSVPSDAGVDPRILREVAGTFATGITIITCAVDGVPHGCAANAVMSLSLQPPLMLISLAETSRTRVAIERSGSFAINILSDDERGRELCSTFSGRADDKFQRSPFRSGCLGSPVLEGSLGRFECSVEDSHVTGDHTIFIGRVHRAAHADGDPLVFFRGRSRSLAA